MMDPGPLSTGEMKSGWKYRETNTHTAIDNYSLRMVTEQMSFDVYENLQIQSLPSLRTKLYVYYTLYAVRENKCTNVL